MIKVNNKQVNKMVINNKEVLKVVLNGATKYQKNTSPGSDEFSISGNRRNFMVNYTTNSSTPPEKIVYEVTGVTGISTPSAILYGANNYFISTRDTNVTQNSTNYGIIYPKGTQSGSSYTCNCYYGSTSGTSCTLQFNSNTKLLTFGGSNTNTTSASISAKIRVAINEDPTFDDFTAILTGNWNWDAKTNSSGGSSTTAFDNFTLPLTYTRIKFNALNVTSDPTSSSFTISYTGKSTTYRSYPMDYANLDKYIIEIPTSHMTTSNTTTPAAYYFDLIGSSSTTQLQFFPAEYLSSSRNRFSWQRKYINATTYSLNINFKIGAQQ